MWAFVSPFGGDPELGPGLRRMSLELARFIAANIGSGQTGSRRQGLKVPKHKTKFPLILPPCALRDLEGHTAGPCPQSVRTPAPHIPLVGSGAMPTQIHCEIASRGIHHRVGQRVPVI